MIPSCYSLAYPLTADDVIEASGEDGPWSIHPVYGSWMFIIVSQHETGIIIPSTTHEDEWWAWVLDSEDELSNLTQSWV